MSIPTSRPVSDNAPLSDEERIALHYAALRTSSGLSEQDFHAAVYAELPAATRDTSPPTAWLEAARALDDRRRKALVTINPNAPTETTLNLDAYIPGATAPLAPAAQAFGRDRGRPATVLAPHAAANAAAMLATPAPAVWAPTGVVVEAPRPVVTGGDRVWDANKMGATPTHRHATAPGTLAVPVTGQGNAMKGEHARAVTSGRTFASAAEAMAAFGADFTVEKQELFRPNGVKSTRRVSVVRTDTGEEIGDVSPDYGLIQNRDVFAAFDTLLAEHGGTYEKAGVFEGGARVWAQAGLNRAAEVVAGDEVRTSVILRNAHDGSGSWIGSLLTYRIVCDNGLVRCDKKPLFVVRHTKNAAARIPNAHALVQGVFAAAQREIESYQRLAARRVTTDETLAYLKILFPDPAELEAQQARKNRERIRDEVLNEMANVRRGGNLEGVKGTAWGMYNGVTAWVDHSRHMRAATDRRQEENWFGTGAELKAEALQQALVMLH